MITDLFIVVINTFHLSLLMLPKLVFALALTGRCNWVPMKLGIALALITFSIPLLNSALGYCPLTRLSQELGDFHSSRFISLFSEKYMRWFYEPVLSLFGLEWNSSNLYFLVRLHWAGNALMTAWYLRVCLLR